MSDKIIKSATHYFSLYFFLLLYENKQNLRGNIFSKTSKIESNMPT